MEQKIKPFDNQLEQPENYANKEKEVQGCIINKYMNLIDNLEDDVLYNLDIAIGSEGAHSDISQ